MKKLNDYIKKDNVDFLIIAGDNYYPDKKKVEDKKIKNMNTEYFLSGINCLPKELKKYILLGNHEYDNMLVDGEIAEKCHLIKEEKKLFSGVNNTFFNDVITHRHD